MFVFPDNTVGGNLIHAAQRLKESGIKESRSEAEILMAHTLNLTRWKLYLQKEDILSAKNKEIFWQAVAKRSRRCPLAYITGMKEFFGYDFLVSPDVLIPRPETEFIINAATSFIKGQKSSSLTNHKILDMGTGSGIIAITLALLLPGAQIYAADISRKALLIARKNACLHKVEERIVFLEGDFWEALGSESRQFNVVVSNPPYICTNDIENLASEIRDYEPRNALDGGADGLHAYKKIITRAPEYLAEPGVLILETGEDTLGGIMKLFKKQPRFSSIETLQDYRGHDRVIVAYIS